MALIECPDCQKQISDRATNCPHCGCPSEVWKSPNLEVRDNIVNDIKDECNLSPKPDAISFNFGGSYITYPQSTKILSEIYGDFCYKADNACDKYFDSYNRAGDIYSVLTTLATEVQNDLNKMVEIASKYLYSCGIAMTTDEFQNVFSIKFYNSIESLYSQYHAIEEEASDLEYERQYKKESRGKWRGGGFGIVGALKGAMTAAVLNAGSSLVHAVGDGVASLGDRHHISKKFKAMYRSEKNRDVFVNGVYVCYLDILAGILTKLSEYKLIDESIFECDESMFDMALKYETDSEKFFSVVLKCIRSFPHKMVYYDSILKNLFELDCELEEFLEFWNLKYIYENLEKDYLSKTYGEIKNPFIKNTCSFAMDIDSVVEDGGAVKITGKIIKGKIQKGDITVLMANHFKPITSANILKIESNSTIVENVKVGRYCSFYLDLKYRNEFNNCNVLVDEIAFEKEEFNLYAVYKDDPTKEFEYMDFVDSYKNNDSAIITVDKDSYYCSSRGITFSDSIEKIKKMYGEGIAFSVDLDNDTVYQKIKTSDFEDAETISNATHGILYSFGKEYNIKMYFNDKDELLLIVYLKNISAFSEIDLEGEIIENKKTINMTWSIICSSCNKEIDKNSKFCNSCGEISYLYSKECPICKKRIKKEVKFCNFCGHKKFD